MGDIIEGVKALDFNPDLVTDNVSVDSSRAVKVSTLFVDKITALYSRRVDDFVGKKEVKIEEPEEDAEEEMGNTAAIEIPVKIEPEVEVEEEVEPVIPEEPIIPEPFKIEEPVIKEPMIKEPEIEVAPIDPDGTLLDIASSFEMAVAQIHEKKAELENKEKDIDRIRGELLIKEEKTNKLLEELEKMKKDVENSKKEADKMLKDAEVQEKMLKKQTDAFEAERQKFLSNLKVTTGSIMTMVEAKHKAKED